MRAALVAAAAALAAGEVASDRVTTVPGLEGELDSRHWSGYMSVANPNGGGTLHFHYYFVENAAKDPKAPVVVWNNGGPGSSSLMAFMTENGPLTVNDDSFNTDAYAATGVPTVFLNPHSWHAAANVLYVEHPVPTGFSYCDGDCGQWNDTSQAAAQYGFLTTFFAKYPEFAANPFYMAGESYAGVLVPTAALQILAHRTPGNSGRAPWSLNGLLLGNDCPGTRVETCTPYSGWVGAKTAVDFRYYHAMIKEETYRKIQDACAPYWLQYDAPPEPCRSLLGDPVRPVMGEAGDTYQMGGGYFLYDLCQPDLEALSGAGRAVPVPPREGAAARRAAKEPYNLRGGEYACGQERGGSVWLNLPEVQDALHVRLVGKSSFAWSMPLDYSYTAHTLVPDYVKTLLPSLRVWQYSGDADPCVPSVGTQRWIDSMNLTVSEQWRPWTAPSTIPVTGYVTKYDANGFTFLTFRDAGHMVPRYRPREALYMFKAFLNDSRL